MTPRNLPTLLAIAALAITTPAVAQLRPFVYRVLSHEVIDGDTVRTELDLGFDLRITLLARIDGVDAPEKTTAAGKAVRDHVRQWCASQQSLIAVSIAKDKYAGRYLAELHGDFGPLADHLLAEKLARHYDGSARKPWGEAELDAIEKRVAALRQPVVTEAR